MKLGILLLCRLFLAVSVPEEWIGAAMLLCGVSEEENLPEEELDRFAHYASNPLRLNTASLQRLKESGLLRDFQASSLVEYRLQTGNVNSYVELGLVPGFDPQVAQALSFFTTLESAGGHGGGFHGKLRLQASARRDAQEPACHKYSIRYEAVLGSLAELRWTSRTTYDSPSFGPGTISGAYHFRTVPLKLVLGNFNARFGQGLCSWSGTTLNSFGTADALRRNGTGISVTGSAGADLCGIGAEFSPGRWTFSSGVSFAGGIGVVARASYDWKRLSLGLNGNFCASSGILSADTRCSIRAWGLYGEAALKMSPALGTAVPAIVCGAFRDMYPAKLAFALRWYHPLFMKEWSGASAVYQGKEFSCAADAGFRGGESRYRALLSYTKTFRAGALMLSPKFRTSARFSPLASPQWRCEVRAELPATVSEWEFCLRGNVLWSRGCGTLCYAQTGHKGDALGIYARLTLFDISDWENRIYVYEKDAPGNFNVPAYYGRGWAASLYCAFRPDTSGRLSHQAFLRFSFLSYPWNPAPKPSRLELRFQYALSL